MPAVARADQHCVDIRALEDLFVEARRRAGGVAVVVIDHFFADFPAFGEQVADRGDAHVFLLQKRRQVAAVSPADADDPERDAVGRGGCPVQAQSACRREQRRRGRFAEFTAGNLLADRHTGVSVQRTAPFERQ